MLNAVRVAQKDSRFGREHCIGVLVYQKKGVVGGQQSVTKACTPDKAGSTWCSKALLGGRLVVFRVCPLHLNAEAQQLLLPINLIVVLQKTNTRNTLIVSGVCRSLEQACTTQS